MANLSSKTGFTPVQTRVTLGSLASAITVQNFAAYDSQELTGFVYLDATTDLRASVKVMVNKNGAGTYEVVSVDIAGDSYSGSPIVSFSMSGSDLRATLPAGVPGFVGANSYIQYQLNAPALGGNFPLTVDGSNVTAASATAQGSVTTGAQTFAGAKTFSSTITGSITGNAGTVTNGVYTTGNQTIAGAKTFTSDVTSSLGFLSLGGYVEVGTNRAADGAALVDLTSQSGAIDYNARIVRNSGANGTLQIVQTGTGTIQFQGYLEQSSGIGIKYSGISGGNFVGFKWASPNLIGRIDNVVDVTLANVSDHRIKRNVETITEPALNRISDLRPVTYQMADYQELFKASDEVHEGFIAHELQEVIPSAVHGQKDDPNQIQSLKLDALCAVMVKAIQELSAKVDAQAAEIAALKAGK